MAPQSSVSGTRLRLQDNDGNEPRMNRTSDCWPSTLTRQGSRIFRCTHSVVSCDPEWEAAYERFETPEEEIQKFVGRLKTLQLHRLPKTTQVVEIFCGRGSGLIALEQLGFSDREGVDLSEPLLTKYAGTPLNLYVADCRALPFGDNSKDLLIVQGGLHHLSALPEDVDRTISEVKRVLRPGGRLAIVEPYPSRTLSWIHRLSEWEPFRRLSPRLDALAVMTERERTTYENWLRMIPSIRNSIKQSLEPLVDRITWTKWMFVGRKSLQGARRNRDQ